MVLTFETAYPDDPWSGIVDNQRQWYDPVLRSFYMRNAVYMRQVDIQFDQSASPANSETINITAPIMPHVNIDPGNKRDIWLPTSRIDSFQRQITYNTYGGKLAFHKYDKMISYWKANKQDGLTYLINNGLGYMMMETLETLARNAFLVGAATSGYGLFGGGTGSNFGGIGTTATDRFGTDIVRAIALGARSRDVQGIVVNPIAPQESNLFCIISPGAAYDLKAEAEASGNADGFIDILKYADPRRIIANEIGAYMGVRFIESSRAILFNAGNITKQTTVTTAISAGDGAPAHSSLVDGTYKSGQSSGVTNYIAVASSATFAVGDVVTIHVDRTNTFGVANGLDWRDGKAHNRTIVSIDTGGANRLTFETPIMEDFDTDLGGGVYGYVTKARHIHTALTIVAPQGVAMGVAQPPMIYTPDELGIIDDKHAQHRFSWDAYLGYQLFHPEAFECWFGAGAWKGKGAVVYQ